MTNEEIENRIAQAPGPFREILERLHRKGVLTDPKFKAALLLAMQRVANQQREESAVIRAANVPVQNPTNNNDEKPSKQTSNHS
jgi:hypothetical protein